MCEQSPLCFSLERVREVRAHEEDLAREAFAASLSLRARGVALLADAQARAATARERVIAQTAPRRVPHCSPSRPGSSASSARRSRPRWSSTVALDELEQRRAALTSAGQRRQVLDRLKDRKREAHQLESGRREAVALDEIALNGHMRRLAS